MEEIIEMKLNAKYYGEYLALEKLCSTIVKKVYPFVTIWFLDSMQKMTLCEN